jgi:hypothetical protein
MAVDVSAGRTEINGDPVGGTAGGWIFAVLSFLWWRGA